MKTIKVMELIKNSLSLGLMLLCIVFMIAGIIKAAPHFFLFSALSCILAKSLDEPLKK